ncbi:MAG: hypothetical protein KTR31_37580 [Myxococcales bacterium]|nr:hypothetical protein [Myxococcales bacterium]
MGRTNELGRDAVLLLTFALAVTGCETARVDAGGDDAYRVLTEEEQLSRAHSIGASAIGRGYDSLAQWAHPDAVERPVLDYDCMVRGEVIGTPRSEVIQQIDYATGNSLSDYSRSLSLGVGAEGSIDIGVGSFSGAFSTEFDAGLSGSQSAAFVTLRDLEKRLHVQARVPFPQFSGTATKGACESSPSDWPSFLRTYLTPGAQADFAPEGDLASRARNILDQYGSHVVTSGWFGGRIDFTMTVDGMKMSQSFGLASMADVSYESVGRSGSVSVSQEIQSASSEVEDGTSTKLRVVGGLGNLTKGMTDDQIDAWLDALRFDSSEAYDSGFALVDFPNEALMPITWFIEDADLRNQVAEEYEARLAGAEVTLQDTDLVYEIHTTATATSWSNDPGSTLEVYGTLEAHTTDHANQVTDRATVWHREESQSTSIEKGGDVKWLGKSYFVVSNYEAEDTKIELLADLVEDDDVGDDAFDFTKIVLDLEYVSVEHGDTFETVSRDRPLDEHEAGMQLNVEWTFLEPFAPGGSLYFPTR